MSVTPTKPRKQGSNVPRKQGHLARVGTVNCIREKGDKVAFVKRKRRRCNAANIYIYLNPLRIIHQ